MDRLDKALNHLETALAVLAGFLLLFIAFSICATIALRTLNLQVPLWSVQFNEYSLLWITFLGGAWLLRKKRHVSLDILTRRLSGRRLGMLNTFHAVLGLLVCGFLTWICGAVVWDHFQRGVIDVRAVDVPKHWILAVIFVGFLILTLQFMCEMLQAFKQLQEDQ
jgi:C4-dicarboxylate transporter, DctQ subunit